MKTNFRISIDIKASFKGKLTPNYSTPEHQFLCDGSLTIYKLLGIPALTEFIEQHNKPNIIQTMSNLKTDWSTIHNNLVNLIKPKTGHSGFWSYLIPLTPKADQDGSEYRQLKAGQAIFSGIIDLKKLLSPSS